MIASTGRLSRSILRRGAAVLCASALAVTPMARGMGPRGQHEHAAREHTVVRIGDLGLIPKTRELGPDDAVVWINYARPTFRITLEGEAITRVHCREPSHFELDSERKLRSLPIEMMETASLCLLEQGTYRYRVEELDMASRPLRALRGGQRYDGVLRVREGNAAASRRSDLRVLARNQRGQATLQRQLATMHDRLADIYEKSGRDVLTTQDHREKARKAREKATEHDAEASALEAARSIGP